MVLLLSVMNVARRGTLNRNVLLSKARPIRALVSVRMKMMKARGDSSNWKRRSKEVKKSGSSIKCYKCGKKGHIKPECPSLKARPTRDLVPVG